MLRAVQPTGPLACMEFWVGWFDSCGDSEHHTRPAQETAADLGRVLEIGNASVNIYMFHGGTNWGLRAGGNLHERFLTPSVKSCIGSRARRWHRSGPRGPTAEPSGPST